MKDKIEIGPDAISEMMFEWHSERISKAEAASIFKRIRHSAEDLIRQEAFRIITALSDQNRE